MASAARSMRLVCRGCRSQRAIPRRIGPIIFVAWKSVSSGGSSAKAERSLDNTPESRSTVFDHYEEADREIFQKYGRLEAGQIARMLTEEDGFEVMDEGLDPLSVKVRKSKRELADATKPLRMIVKPKKNAFWDDDEEDTDLITNKDSDEFNENDMTDIAHAKLEEHREQRAYARLAIWEMPLLSKFAKPFEPPTVKEPLRFRFTSYMGEYHPAEKKVVVEFSPQDFFLSEVQILKLKKLAGPRYNPEKDTIKMSCESFEHQAQNKRHLAELVMRLLEEARDPTDTFEDIPLDLRHHKFNPKPKFPKEWRISQERAKEIMAYRQETKLLEAAKESKGGFVDGMKVIEAAHKTRSAAQAVPALMAANSAPRRNTPRARF